MHLLVIYLSYENVWSKLQKKTGALETRNITQTVTIYSPHPVLLSRLWTTIQQAHIELTEDGFLKRRNM
jgi:hypothetical protein